VTERERERKRQRETHTEREREREREREKVPGLFKVTVSVMNELRDRDNTHMDLSS
jgi:hypothetical protein